MDHGPLEIGLLGPLEVRRGGQRLALPRSRKARALLAYLVATERTHPRDHLCDLLWEGPADPRAALRWSLSKLRPLLDDARTRRLVSDGERVGFAPVDAAVDLAEVRAAVAPDPGKADLAVLREAAARFRGEFLEGMDLARCYRFDTWCSAEREAARRLRDTVLATLVERLRDRPDEALRYARDRLLRDPIAEAAHRDVIRLLRELGRPREALEQYEICRRILKRELGVRPSAELEAVRRSIARVERVEVAAGSGPPAAPAPQPPLIGRQKEREELERLVSADAAARGAAVLFVVGEPGIGKTRLLEELRAMVRAVGGEVLSGRAYEAEMVRPYGAWIDALRSIPAEEIPVSLRSELAPLLPELGPAPLEAADRTRLFDAVVQLLAGRSGECRIALILDDVQWLDEASTALLHFVTRGMRGTNVVLACASREAEIQDNPALLRLLRDLRRERLARQLELARLDAEDTALLVERVNPALDPARVFAESEGNPLFALEIARAWREEGRSADALPGTLDGLIGDRLAQLDPEARDLVPWAAALGHGFRLDVLLGATELPATTLLRAIEELERRGFLEARPDGYDFTHDLIREVAYRRTAEPRRRLIHLQVARVLDSLEDPEGEHAGEVAHHAALGGDTELAARACLSAARHALWVFAYEEAAELIARGIQHLPGLRRETRLALHLELLGLYVYPGLEDHRIADLEDELSRVIQEAQAAGLKAQTHRGFQLIADYHFLSGDFDSALDRSFRAHEAGRTADPATVVRAIGDTARCLGILERDMPRAAKLARQAEALASAIGYEGHELPQALGYVHLHAGELDDAAACFERAAALARDERERWFECSCLSHLVMIEIERGRLAEAETHSRTHVEVARKLGEGSDAPFSEALEALISLKSGEDDAVARLDRALEELRVADSRWMIAYVQNSVARAMLDTGRAEEARARAREALDSAGLIDRRNEIAVARALLARIALPGGDAAGAQAHIDTIRPDLAVPGSLSARARGAVEAVIEMLQEIPTQIPTPAPTTGEYSPPREPKGG